MSKLHNITRAAALMLLAASPAAAQQYGLSGWLPPTHVMTREIAVGWADKVRGATGGAVDFEVFVGGVLLPPLGTMQGVATGVAQAGHDVPSELPIANLVGELGHQTPDPMVLTFAYLDYSMNDPQAYQEWRNNGVIPGATVSTPLYYYFCRDTPHSLAEMRGKRVRAPGGGWARFTKHAGMVPVNVPASEIYTSMERGAVDCVAADPTQLNTGATIMELTKSMIDLPLSPAYNALHIVYNPDFWKGLSEEQRRQVFDATATAMASALVTFDRESAAAIEEAKAKGVEIIAPDPEFTKAYQDWINDNVGGLFELARSTMGIADPETPFNTMQGYIDKWTALLEGVDRTNVDAVAAVLKSNLFDKVDVATYGTE